MSIIQTVDDLVNNIKMALEKVLYTLRSKCPWGARFSVQSGLKQYQLYIENQIEH